MCALWLMQNGAHRRSPRSILTQHASLSRPSICQEAVQTAAQDELLPAGRARALVLLAPPQIGGCGGVARPARGPGLGTCLRSRAPSPRRHSRRSILTSGAQERGGVFLSPRTAIVGDDLGRGGAGGVGDRVSSLEGLRTQRGELRTPFPAARMQPVVAVADGRGVDGRGGHGSHGGPTSQGGSPGKVFCFPSVL